MIPTWSGQPPDNQALVELATDAAGRLIASLSELAQHLGGGEGEQFYSDLRQLMHNIIDQLILPNADHQQVLEFQHEVVALLDAWVISMCLDGSPEWHRQVDDATEALLSDDQSYFGNQMTTEELHHFGA